VYFLERPTASTWRSSPSPLWTQSRTDVASLVKVPRVGVDGTDNEINAAEYEAAPPGYDCLVIGHGRVEAVGPNVTALKAGDYVVATVRRPGKSMDLTYQFSPSSMVGASGSYYFTNYDAIPGTNSTYRLFDSRSWITNGFYAHRFTNWHGTGVGYNFQCLLFDPGLPTDVNRILSFYSAPVTSRMALSFWLGPEYFRSVAPLTMAASGRGMLFSDSGWGVAGGVSLIWQGSRASFRLACSQQISDWGGYAQAVKMQSAPRGVEKTANGTVDFQRRGELREG
jgi:hypothetical protein